MGLLKSLRQANQMINEFEQVSGMDTRSALSLVAQIKSGTPFRDTEVLIIGAEAIRNADLKAATDLKAAYLDTIEAWQHGRLTFASGTPLNEAPGMTQKHIGYIAAGVLAATRPQAARRIGDTLQAAGI